MLWIFACPGQIISSIRPMSFINLATDVPIWGGGDPPILLHMSFLPLEGLYLRRFNCFELYPLVAVLLNLKTDQSYAQLSIACNTLESPIKFF